MNSDGSETLPTPTEPNKFWWCRGCNQEKIHLFTSERSLQVEKELNLIGWGAQYVCLSWYDGPDVGL